MVVDSYRQCLLRGFLADHVFLEEVEDLTWFGQLEFGLLRSGLAEFLFDDLIAQSDAFIADVNTRSGDEFPNLLLRLPTEVAFEQVCSVRTASHCHNLSTGRLAPTLPIVFPVPQ